MPPNSKAKDNSQLFLQRLVYIILTLSLFAVSPVNASSTANFDPVVLASGAQYQGDFLDGIPNGRGVLTRPNGDVYRGAFVDGEFHGQGTYKASNGDFYNGAWAQGMREGFGSETYANGNLYEGAWLSNKRHGEGKLAFPSGTNYEGEWKYDLKHGEGKFLFENGQRYIGSYIDDLRHGDGVFVKANGESYRGTFSKDQEHGVGECGSRVGNRQTCLFKRGLRILKQNLVERAIKYQEQNTVPDDFLGGVAFSFEDDLTRGHRYLRNYTVWWESSGSMLCNELRIISKGQEQSVNFTIHEYSGPGKYTVKKEDALVMIGGDQLYLSDEFEAIVEVTSDKDGLIEGRFSIPSLISQKNNVLQHYAINNGQFELRNRPPFDN